VALITELSPNKPVVLVGHDWGAGLAWSTAHLHPELVSKLVIINGAAPDVFLQVLKTSPAQREQSKYVDKLDSWLAKLLFAWRGADLFWDGISHLHENGHVDDSFKQAYLSAWEQPGAAQAAVNWYAANFPDFEVIQKNDYSPKLTAQVSVPSLLIWSKNDPAFTDDVFTVIPEYFDELRVEVIDTDSHTPFLDNSELVIKHMRTFLEQDSSPP
jgi:pimeloyl-ACP methyl ester carboxylesterase